MTGSAVKDSCVRELAAVEFFLDSDDSIVYHAVDEVPVAPKENEARIEFDIAVNQIDFASLELEVEHLFIGESDEMTEERRIFHCYGFYKVKHS